MMKKPVSSSILIFLLYRVSSVFIVQTYYVPDEYWQSLEVAHNMAFGYGYLTWEWKFGLRSYLYPSFFAFAYKCLEFFHLDSVYLVILTPKLLQAFLTALSDQYFVLLCDSFGFDTHWAKVYILTNWFWYYCGFRTITNTFETALSIIALYYFPWNLFIKNVKGKKDKCFHKESLSEMKTKSLIYITLSAFDCIVRPTALTIWGPLVLLHLISLPSKTLKYIVLNCILPVLFCTLTLSVMIDFFCYGKITLPAYNFLIFNILKNVSTFYGTHPIYWYISQGLPAVLGLHVLPFAVGFISLIMEIFTKTKNLLTKIFGIWIFILVINIIILSNIPHKEFRFVLPLLPLMTLISVKISSDFFATSSKVHKFLWTFLLVIAFIILTALFGVFHQGGPIQLMKYLSDASLKCIPNCSFLFLMPCHSTPLYSYLHANVSTRFITCEPPITDNFWDESEDFFNNPIQWLQEYWDDKKPPTHVSFFDTLENSVSSFLKDKGFTKKQEFHHAFFADKRTGKQVVVYEPS